MKILRYYVIMHNNNHHRCWKVVDSILGEKSLRGFESKKSAQSLKHSAIAAASANYVPVGEK